VAQACFVGVGVDEYDHFGQLDYAVHEVRLVRSVLDENVVGEPLENPDESAARHRLNDLAEALPAGGILIALWSGHGKDSPNGACGSTPGIAQRPTSVASQPQTSRPRAPILALTSARGRNRLGRGISRHCPGNTGERSCRGIPGHTRAGRG